MKLDLYNLKDRYDNWKESAIAEGIEGINKTNSKTIMAYVLDMEKGLNVARGSKKGGRSYARLHSIRQRLIKITELLEKRGVKDITKTKDKDILSLFSEMDKGEIVNRTGEKYKSRGDYAKGFKSFWHWHMKTNRKQGKVIADITEDLDTTSDKPKFVWLKKEEVEKVLQYFKEDEQIMFMFMFDSIVRSPTELLSIKREDITEKDGEVWVHIDDSISKTFGRDFNLLYCGNDLLKYIERKGLKAKDNLFVCSPAYLNWKLGQVSGQIWGDSRPHPKCDSYKRLNFYDFRHSGAIHLRLLAKDNPAHIGLDAIRHRGGWTDFKMLNYYTEFLGLDGKIDKQGMLLKQDKSQLEAKQEIMGKVLYTIGKALKNNPTLQEELKKLDIEQLVKK